MSDVSGMWCRFVLTALSVVAVVCLTAAYSVTVASRGGSDAPHDCKWERVSPMEGESSLNDDIVQLSCRLRTIGGTDGLLDNLTSSQTERITALRLECSDTFFYESTLEENRHQGGGGFLSQLRHLHKLTIEYCKIRYVPSSVLAPLQDLRHLTIRTHNDDWSTMTMEFNTDSFRGLSQLRSLDLSDNNIWALPQELFCPLVSLTHLNMTRNRLQNASELGFSDWGEGPTAPGKSCNVGLEVLDLSNNDLPSLPDNGFTSLRQLQNLFLQDNKMTNLAERAFVGLVALQRLNVSSNQLTNLPPELFQSSRDIKELHLNNNSISVLAPGLLAGLDQLLVLDLSNNQLTNTWVNRDTFSGLVRLVILNLAHNKITRLDSHVLQDLYSLQILNLHHNNIEVIAEGAFAALTNIHAITLSHNNLIRVEDHHFSGLYVLHELYLDHNSIVSIHPQSFENCSNLQQLGLAGNKLTKVPEGLNYLRFLKTLDLGENHISELNNDSFHGLEQLTGLRLIDNDIVNITKDTFSSLPSLRILSIADNKIQHVERGALGSSPTLHAIRLDGNKLTDLTGMFSDLPGLVWLNVSANQIKWFDYFLLPASLEWLDMHKNRIPELENNHDRKDNIPIKHLDASFNKLTDINDNAIPNSVETLVLNDNYIREVKPGTFLNKVNLSRVVLYGNKIQNLEESALLVQSVPGDKKMPEFYIGGNPFFCDCTMEWLTNVNKPSPQRNRPLISDLDSVTCNLPHSRGAPTRPLLDMRPSQFLCQYETHCFSVCHCCDFDACDCEMTCPDNCKCYHDHSWTSNVVDCSNAGYRSVPTGIPMDATEIYLDGNDLGDLGSHVFIGKKKLQVLYLNGSNIGTIHNRTFNGVPSLRVLHMENNQLQELRGFEFNQLENLKELFLDHNSISHVGNQTFRSMQSLEVLRLDNNKIVDFSPWQQLSNQSVLGKLAQLSLEGNLWTCDCDSVFKLEVWLKENAAAGKAIDLEKMHCSGNKAKETMAEVIARCSKSNNDANAVVTSAVQRSSFYNTTLLGNDYVPIVAATLVTIIVVFLLSAVLFIFRNDVRLWVHSRYGIRIFRDPMTSTDADEEKDRLYDAYMAYSIKDEDFVSQVIASELEQSGYSLCLHYRDIHLMSGTSYLADAVLGASDASRRIVLVLSLSFLQNEWDRAEFRTALQASLEQKRKMRRHKVIVLLTTAVDTVHLDPELQLLLRTCTVISWGDKRFWEKLRFAMPDVVPASRTKRASKGLNTDPKGHGGGGLGVSGKARYTAAPTSLDAWYKYAVITPPTQPHPTAPPLMNQAVLPTPTPTQSTYVSEGSSGQRDEEDERPAYNYATAPSIADVQSQHSYVSIDGRHNPYQLHYSLQRHRNASLTKHHRDSSGSNHVYSTIPDNLPVAPAGPASYTPTLCRLANGEIAVIQAAPHCVNGLVPNAPGRTYFV